MARVPCKREIWKKYSIARKQHRTVCGVGGWYPCRWFFIFNQWSLNGFQGGPRLNDKELVTKWTSNRSLSVESKWIPYMGVAPQMWLFARDCLALYYFDYYYFCFVLGSGCLETLFLYCMFWICFLFCCVCVLVLLS